MIESLLIGFKAPENLDPICVVEEILVPSYSDNCLKLQLVINDDFLSLNYLKHFQLCFYESLILLFKEINKKELKCVNKRTHESCKMNLCIGDFKDPKYEWFTVVLDNKLQVDIVFRNFEGNHYFVIIFDYEELTGEINLGL